MPARVRVDGGEYDAEFSAGGASTLHEHKKSYNLRFDGDGWNGRKQYRLSANARDRSMMRALLTTEVLKAAGVPGPEMEPVFVYLNNRALGLYIGTETIDSGFFERRNLKVDRWYEAKGDADFAGTFAGAIRENYSVEPEGDDLERILELARALDTGDDAAFGERIFRHLDREGVIRYLVAGAVLDHWDGFNKNIHLAEVAPDRRLLPVAWDFDFVWTPRIRSSPKPWDLNRLFTRIESLPDVRAEVQARVRQLIQGPNSIAVLRAVMESWRERIRAAYLADPYLGRASFTLDQEAEQLMADIAQWYGVIQ